MTAMVSVIVPVRNTAAFLRECVDSIMSQSGVEVELLLVDDGSDDGSEEICAAYAARFPSKVKMLCTHGGGVSVARNLGIKEAKGEYVAFADSDDTYYPGALAMMAEILDSNPACDMVSARFAACKKDTARKGAVQLLPAVDVLESTLYQLQGYHPSACAKLYRRSLLEKTGEVFVPGRRYEDLEAWTRICANASCVAVTDVVVYYYRPNPSSFINTWSESRIDALWAVDTISAFVHSRFPHLDKAAAARRFSAYYNVFNLASVARREDVAQKCWQYVRKSRRGVLADPKVRVKNKIGAVLSLLGRRIVSRIYLLCR